MDVRCERCKSEYQVEDAHVSDLGTEVQCSDCGHQFVVKRPTSALSQSRRSPSPDSDEGGTWVIETASGRSLRLRDLTTLHKWIIQRRVGRADRLSRGGDPWQQLGDMAELSAFFDIVDSAERARTSDTPGPASRLAPLAVPTLERPQFPSPPPATVRKLFAKASPRPSVVVTTSAQERVAAALISPSLYDGEADETVIVRLDAPKRKSALKLVLAVLVAVGVAGLGIVLLHFGLRPARTTPAMVTRTETTAAPEIAALAPVPATEGATAEDPDQDDGSAAKGPVVEPIADSHQTEKVHLLGGKRARTLGGRKGKAPPAPAAQAQGGPASSAKSNAPQAAAAQGYVALNHRQPAKAVALFKKALAANPNNGTALFGLAEAYRTGNQFTPALLAYRRYVELLPSGPDAGSARHHIRTLESKKR